MHENSTTTHSCKLTSLGLHLKAMGLHKLSDCSGASRILQQKYCICNNSRVFQGGRNATETRQSKETLAMDEAKNLKSPCPLWWVWGNRKKDNHFLNDFSVRSPSRDSSRHLEVQFEEGLGRHIFWSDVR